MKPLLQHSLTLFFSLIVLLSTLSSCKKDKEATYSIEETQIKEREHILQLLERSRIFIENDDLSSAITTLDTIINKYGTYDEVEQAYDLKEDAQRRYVLKKIRTQTNIDSLYTFIDDYDQKEIKDAAKKKVGDIVQNTDDSEVLGDFIESNRLPEYRRTAKDRLGELKAKEEADRYAAAVAANDSDTWKKFLRDYENRPDRKEIEDEIIKTKVDEIFAGEYGEIPSTVRTGQVNYVNSTIDITNDTPYTLTILYSGPENKRIVIGSGMSKISTMKSGSYRITASVSAARVSNYAGREVMQGDYSSTFYIR
jgi:hypothetical protein